MRRTGIDRHVTVVVAFDLNHKLAHKADKANCVVQAVHIVLYCYIAFSFLVSDSL